MCQLLMCQETQIEGKNESIIKKICLHTWRTEEVQCARNSSKDCSGLRACPHGTYSPAGKECQQLYTGPSCDIMMGATKKYKYGVF